MSAETNNLGAWEADRDALKEVRISGRGSDADIPGELQFARGVTQLVSRRERRSDAEYDRLAAFVLVPAGFQESGAPNARRNPSLHTGNRPLTGRIHFVSAKLAGRTQEYLGDDTALLDVLKQLGADQFPTLIYTPSPNHSSLSYYPKGVVDEDQRDSWDVAEVNPSADAITEVIDRVYQNELVTPDQSANFHVWMNAGKGWAQEDAEARVQHALKCGLAGAFRHCSIRPEQPGKEGRTDLEIVSDEGRPPDKIVHHAVLELKVLREFGSTGGGYSDDEINTHIQKGLEQAYAYGLKRSMRERLLCCFDMRKLDLGDTVVFAFILDRAQELKVCLRRWFLYRNSAEWRAVMAAAVSTASAPPNLHSV
jgi:hypothetical protein